MIFASEYSWFLYKSPSVEKNPISVADKYLVEEFFS